MHIDSSKYWFQGHIPGHLLTDDVFICIIIADSSKWNDGQIGHFGHTFFPNVNLISSYSIRHSDDPTPLNMFEYAPLNRPFKPSALYTFLKQSIMPKYYFSALHACMNNLRLTVSPGYEICSATMTDICAQTNFTKIGDSISGIELPWVKKVFLPKS